MRSADWTKLCILFIPGQCAIHGTEESTEGETAGANNGRQTPKRSFSLLNTSSTCRTPVSLHQIISLVSITSPRSFRPYKVSVSPSFVEFDMTDSGYGCVPVTFYLSDSQKLVLLKLHLSSTLIIAGYYISRCLFLPSLATVKGVSADSIPTGGIGGGETCFFFLL